MSLVVVLVLGLALGLVLRRWTPPSFAAVFRSQQLVILLPLALFSGWALRWQPRELLVLAAVLAAELLAVATAIGLARRGREPTLAVAAASNTTFWSVPVAATLVAPAQVVLLAVYDTVVAIRGAVQIRFLRRGSALRHSRRSAVADFAKPLGLAVGLGIGLLSPAPSWAPVTVTRLGQVSGVLGIGILVLALPGAVPGRAALRRVAPAIALRFGFVSAALGLLLLSPVVVPPVTWVIATAPAPFNTVALARLYGYSTEAAAACVLLTVTVSAALLPILVLLVH